MKKEVKPCRGVDCDNHGLQQISNLKVLLTNKEGLAVITEDDTLYSDILEKGVLEPRS